MAIRFDETAAATIRGLFASVFEDERLDEEARSMRELAEVLGVSPDVVDTIIAETRTRTPAAPTDWAIARANLAVLAGTTAVTW